MRSRLAPTLLCPLVRARSWPERSSTPTTTNTKTVSARPSIPARLPEEKLDEVKTYAAMAYTALGCEGLARCDFFVEKGTGRVLINEINTLPGFTAISMYPKLMEHEGLPVPALLDRLIDLALERSERRHG